MEGRCSLLALLFPVRLTRPGCSTEMFPAFVISTNPIPVLHGPLGRCGIICVQAATRSWRKRCPENQFQAEFPIRDPLSPSRSLPGDIHNLFKLQLKQLDMRLDKQRENTELPWI